ncbi:hypothetical protein PBRA_005590 [Plasmodiophora brassicae]|uniref:DUF4218 domain-containing protein n=1 Tax=Plasmodiophora brassicae TaxID=37360 RepID=A0A0G4IP08_PLABS|nr:hypothetical protein PBRA_005590 [Plasmodiophora brassicae]
MSATATIVESVLGKIRWCTGNGDKPWNCFHRRSWKAHDYIQWLGDFGVAVFHSLIHRSIGSKATRQWWNAMFESCRPPTGILSKCIPRQDLPAISLRFRQSLAKLEMLLLMTIPVHSLVHVPDIVEFFGPMSGFVWVFPIERWMKLLRGLCTSTRGQSANIVANYQLMSAAVRLRYDYSAVYGCNKGDPLLFGQSRYSRMDPAANDMVVEFVGASRKRERISDKLRCWLHHHFVTKDWASVNDYPWVMNFLQACEAFADAINASISNYDEISPALGQFDTFCRDRFGTHLVPDVATIYQSVQMRHVTWKARNENTTTDNNYVAVADPQGNMYLGDIGRLLRIEMPCVVDETHASLTPLTLDVFQCTSWVDIIDP